MQGRVALLQKQVKSVRAECDNLKDQLLKLEQSHRADTKKIKLLEVCSLHCMFISITHLNCACMHVCTRPSLMMISHFAQNLVVSSQGGIMKLLPMKMNDCRRILLFWVRLAVKINSTAKL